MLLSPTHVQTTLATISVHASGRKNGGITVAVVLLTGVGMPPSPPSLLPTGVIGDVEPKLSDRGNSMRVSGASGGHTLGSDGAVCPVSFACNGSSRSGACSARIGLDCSPGGGRSEVRLLSWLDEEDRIGIVAFVRDSTMVTSFYTAGRDNMDDLRGPSVPASAQQAAQPTPMSMQPVCGRPGFGGYPSHSIATDNIDQLVYVGG